MKPRSLKNTKRISADLASKLGYLGLVSVIPNARLVSVRTTKMMEHMILRGDACSRPAIWKT